LLVAHDLKLFPLLAKQPRTLQEVCDTLKIVRRPADAILTLCVSAGLLQVQDGRYSLTPLAEDYLLEGSPTYFGGFLDIFIAIDASGGSSIASLKKAVLTNSPQLFGGGDLFKSLEEQAALARGFTVAMHGHSMGAALAWPDLVDLTAHRLLLDIGGGSGAHSIGAALRWPNLQSVVYDLAPECEVAGEFIARYGLQDRIKTHVGDMWNDVLPSADLHFYSNIYHDWPPEQGRLLTQKSFESLDSGLLRRICGSLINDSERFGSSVLLKIGR
jgi:hypothetical protein